MKVAAPEGRVWTRGTFRDVNRDLQLMAVGGALAQYKLVYR